MRKALDYQDKPQTIARQGDLEVWSGLVWSVCGILYCIYTAYVAGDYGDRYYGTFGAQNGTFFAIYTLKC
jgi:hypothetical protein